MNLHFGTHSVAPGANWVANFFTSISKVTVKSRKNPLSRSPIPPEVSHSKCVMTDDPQGSMRPRLRVLA